MKKKIVLIILILFMFFPIVLYASETILNVEYDECSLFGEEFDKKWYILGRPYNNEFNEIIYEHIDTNIQTIRYYINDTALDNLSYTWHSELTNDEVLQLKRYIDESLERWNHVYYYTYDSYGNKIGNKIINIEKGTSTDYNLIIYPISEIINPSIDYVASVSPIISEKQGDNDIDIFESNNVYHAHYQKYEAFLNVSEYKKNISNINKLDIIYESTFTHEVGHILGLRDIDSYCESSDGADENDYGPHHIESIMGYAENTTNHKYISYYDIAGIAITRGFHDDNDHVWMKRINEDQSIDLICSLCNGILYDVEIGLNDNVYQGKPLKSFKSCNHYGENNSDMLLVAETDKHYFYKCQYCRHIEKIDLIYNISSKQKLELDIIFEPKEELIYELNITEENKHMFYFYDVDDVKVELLDENFNKIYMYDLNESYSNLYFIKQLVAGKYFLKLNNLSYLNNIFNGLIINYDDLSHLEDGVNNITNSYKDLKEYYFSSSLGEGFYKFTVNGEYNNGEKISLNYNSINIFTDGTRFKTMNRYSNNYLSIKAVNKNNENSFYTYLCENTLYYLNIDIKDNDYKNLTISIEKVTDTSEINIFNDENLLSYDEILVLSDLTDKFDYFKKLSIKQTGKFYIDTLYVGNQSENIKIVIFKENYIYKQYSLSLVNEININSNNSFITDYINLEEGNYYIGYINLQEGSIESVTITRDITNTIDSIDNGIIVDPSNADYCGTQINMVEKNFTNKSYREKYITKGFTRNIYLDSVYAPNMSREQYKWYSSNEDILEVTKYGTVLGKSIGTAKIYGIYINNPSIIFIEEFTVINNLDETTVETQFTQTYSISSKVDCKVALNFSNSPYPWNQYYEFTFIENNLGATIDRYGIVKSNNIGNLKIRCRYLLNTKYVIIVNLNITS